MRYNTILVVDDSATSRMILRRCLEMAGYSDAIFLEASDGALALDLLEANVLPSFLFLQRREARALASLV